MPPMSGRNGMQPLHVSLVAVPEAVVSTLSGIFDVMNAFKILPPTEGLAPQAPPFQVEIVSLKAGPLDLASRVHLSPTPCLDRVRRLERDQYILGYRAQLNPTLLNCDFVILMAVILDRTTEDVFDKFAQVDSSSTRRHEGTGLGLAIAARLVEMMGGKIGVESEVGRGSAFWFTAQLPVDDALDEIVPVPTDVSGARVLVIDDNPVNRDILTEQLRSWGFDCAAADSGAMGIAFLNRAYQVGVRVDCVILDYQMPGMNGADVAKAMCADDRTVSVPIVCSYGARSPSGMVRLVSSLAAAIPTATVAEIAAAGHAAPFDATGNFVQLVSDAVRWGQPSLAPA